MDSPTIAIHVILQDTINAINQDEANQSRLYCSIAQPYVGNQNIKYHRGIGNLTTIHRPITSFRKLANASNRYTQSQQSGTTSSSAKQESSQTDMENNNNYPATSLYELVTRNQDLKKMGWYWGSISPDFASELVKNEPDGTFLVRDSSSDFYIFSMTFKLENQVHHTRIEHSSGYFSFGRSRKFYCTTMVDFIEQAIESSRNGTLLFFLHRDPEMMGPVEFRMIPLSRMNGSYSLKHLCRFAILPYVRKSKINDLCLPECLKDYLYEPYRSSGPKPNEI